MIQFLLTREHAYTVASFLETWGRGLERRLRILAYEDAVAGARFPRENAVFVFGDLDRLALQPAARAAMERLHDELLAHCGPHRVLNDPRASLLRFDLLRALHGDGINSFNAYRVASGEVPRRYPVFLRRESGHELGTTPFLRSDAEYRATVETLARQGASLEGVLAVEFCDTADASGVFRKYGAFVVGERIVPRHVFFSRHWVQKDPDLQEPGMLAEELAFLERDDHEPALRHVARRANISYGRIDYGVVAGRPQIWEINTNPMFAAPGSSPDDEGGRSPRLPANLRFVAAIADALRAIDPEP